MNKNNSMNHHHGTVVREQWPVGTAVKFKPKGFCSGEPLRGIVVGHLYINVLIVEVINRKWFVSTFRAEKI